MPLDFRGRPRLLLGVMAAVSSSSPVSLSGTVVVTAWSVLRRTVEGDWTGDLNSFRLVPPGVEAMVSLAPPSPWPSVWTWTATDNRCDDAGLPACSKLSVCFRGEAAGEMERCGWLCDTRRDAGSVFGSGARLLLALAAAAAAVVATAIIVGSSSGSGELIRSRLWRVGGRDAVPAEVGRGRRGLGSGPCAPGHLPNVSFQIYGFDSVQYGMVAKRLSHHKAAKVLSLSVRCVQRICF